MNNNATFIFTVEINEKKEKNYTKKTYSVLQVLQQMLRICYIKVIYRIDSI